MQSFRSLLAPGGIGIFSTPYHGYLKNLLLVASGRFDSHFDPLWEGGHLKFFSDAKLKELLTESGFTRFELHRAGRFGPFAKSVVVLVER
jgi:2-polyprenyl-6-hydroxyphenyl methylase/3-demethylubiquinone-9 3-methyltransferase